MAIKQTKGFHHSAIVENNSLKQEKNLREAWFNSSFPHIITKASGWMAKRLGDKIQQEILFQKQNYCLIRRIK